MVYARNWSSVSTNHLNGCLPVLTDGQLIFLKKEFNMDFYIEAVGYLGTAFILLSMMMTSIIKLRIFNMCGSVISAVYSLLCGAYPIVVLNLGMIAINSVQIIRAKKKHKEGE